MSVLVGPLIAFSGSRGFRDSRLVGLVLDRLRAKYPRLLVKVGDARSGLDPILANEARRRGITPDVQVCNWPPSGSSRQERWRAAHERNGRVVRDADMLVAFFAPGERSPGTSDAIDLAKRRRGIPTHIYHEGRWLTE